MNQTHQHGQLTGEQFGLAGLDIPEVVPLNEPADGIPSVISTPRGLRNAIARLSEAGGPVAVDTERASGIRYGQRAFLVQLKRGDSGIILIDPEAFEDLTELNDALAGTEWVIHAATQDLPCLRELGLNPDFLFDTELAARIAGFDRVGLGAMVERLLGFKLAKQHSAEDWSKRPIPEDWLVYAALDVEVLIDLRDALEEELRAQDKLAFAAEEFAYLAAAPDRPAPRDPWRKTKGIHGIRNRRQLTALRNLWYERESLAEKKDVAPKRLLPDAALIQAARQMPRSVPGILAVPGFQTRALKREATRWVRAVNEALADDNPVPYTTPAEGPPPMKAWQTKRPRSYELFQEAKTAVHTLAEQMSIPQENLLTPDTLRRLCWEPPEPANSHNIADRLAQLGARSWQIDLVVPTILPTFTGTLKV
ncbi:ribonuclease D [Rothia sp. LK2588]|uniref:ribonuclease D n=1 Tax=Rothia sp. LK2588 TaxID=3114369 RepID=UPI0034CFE1D0